MSSESTIRAFLLELKQYVGDHGINIAPRAKTNQTLLDLDWGMDELFGMCFGLTPRDWDKGPIPDDMGRPGEIWVFKPVVQGDGMYVKFTRQCNGDQVYFTLISFHRPGMVD